MIKTTHKGEDMTLDIVIDPGFTGIIRGDAHDISEGCSLTGYLVLQIYRRTKIKCLGTSLTGQCRVHFKTTNSVGVPTYDGTESRTILKRKITHIGDQTVTSTSEDILTPVTYEPGIYKFPFSFDIPSTLPHTFRSKHGSIDYELSAFSTRSIFFNSTVRISRPITLRRCLMNDLDPIAPATQTIRGTSHPDIVTYSATSPAMVYCEGGLLTLELYAELKQPERHSVRVVTCGLQEKVLYRTTGDNSLTNQAMHHEESSFPLGYSTFFPSHHHEYNPADLHNYNAIFRLYPRVHPDNRSTLVAVQHHLKIYMLIDDNEALAKRHRKKSNDSLLSNLNTGGKSILSHLSYITQQSDHNLSRLTSSDLSPVHIQYNNRSNHTAEPSTTPPLCGFPSQVSVDSTSGDSLSLSPTSLISTMENLQPFQPDVVRVPSRKLPIEQTDANTTVSGPSSTLGNNSVDHSLKLHHHFSPLKFLRDHKNEQSFECSLSLPIIVTSREEYREGGVPALPDYESSIGQPPSYRTSIQTLPPVPIYPRQSADGRSSVLST